MLDKILAYMRLKNRISGQNRGNLSDCVEFLQVINQESLDVSSSPVSKNEFSTFIRKTHDILITGDSTIKSALFRVIRLTICNEDHCQAIIDEELHWVVVNSLEKDTDQVVMERMQALKLIKQVMNIAPTKFPISFARSLVAISYFKDDNIRRVCLETLRELSIVHPEIVANVNGFTCLLEAVLDPSIHDMCEPIVMSLLYLMGNQSTRKFVRPYLDLRILLAPFSDLDTELADSILRWKSARAAFVIVMRTWVGLVILTSDPLGLSSLVTMLKDKKVSSALQDVILESFIELFEPIVSKSQKSRKAHASNNIGMFNSKDAAAMDEAMNNMFDENISTTSSAIHPRGGSYSNGNNNNMYPTYGADPKETRTFSQSNNSNSSSFNNNKSYVNTFLKAATPVFKAKGKSFEFQQKERSNSDPTNILSSSQQSQATSYLNTNSDPIYNLLDSYAAVLCCSFLSCGIIESLLFLGTQNESDLGKKARNLLLDFLRVIVRIFPESFCSELLTMPVLLEYTTSLNITGGSHCASQILLSLADAFSITPETLNTASDAKYIQNESEYTNSLIPPHKPPRVVERGSPFTNIMPFSGLKFTPTNYIRNIRDLSMEMKSIGVSSGVNYNKMYPNGTHTNFSTANYHLLQDLNSKMVLTVDKQDFKKLMDLSKVIGKEGKEALKWEWNVIQDMLKSCFTSAPADRIMDAIEARWMRRVTGFFRCTTVSEKAYFAHMEWEPGNLFYLNCFIDVYQVLISDPKGMFFIENERKPTLFQDIAKELQLMLELNGNGWSAAASSSSTLSTAQNNSNSNLQNYSKLIFRFTSCSQTLTREYFTFIGHLLKSENGRFIVENETGIQIILLKLGFFKPLDYLSRAVLLGLSFYDKGYYSYELINNWCYGQNSTKLKTIKHCSKELHLFMLTILLALLRNRISDFIKWGIDAVVDQLAIDNLPLNIQAYLFNLIQESLQHPKILTLFIKKKPKLLNWKTSQDNTKLNNIILRFASCDEGIEFLQSKSLISELITNWVKTENAKYSSLVETSIAKALSRNFIKRKVINIEKIPVVMAEKYGSRNSEFSQLHHYEDNNYKSLLGGEDVDIEGLLRIPWNMEIKLSSFVPPINNSTSESNKGMKVSNATNVNSTSEYLRVDAFLDASELSFPLSAELSCDALRTVKIRGVILDGKGSPTHHLVGGNKTISCCLLAGTNAVHRNGKVSTGLNEGGRKNQFGGTVAGGQSGTSPPIDDLPITLNCENLHDWSFCKPHHRQGNVVNLDDNKFAVTVPEHPVTWIFSRGHPSILKNSQSLSTNTSINGINAAAASIKNSINTSMDSRMKDKERDRDNKTITESTNIYLCEVHYYLKLETGLPYFVPIPRHFFGELAKTVKGCNMLSDADIISNLIKDAKNDKKLESSRRSAFWALGQIGSSEIGFNTLCEIDFTFLEWCTNFICQGRNFPLRGTAFYCLGLLSRSIKGAKRLRELNWISASSGSHSAVAIPQNMSILFQYEYINDMDTTTTTTSSSSTTSVSTFDKDAITATATSSSSAILSTLFSLDNNNKKRHGLSSYFKKLTSSENEVVDLIVKMPGVIVYGESKQKLDLIKSTKPQVFSSRQLYLAVRCVLDIYTFKLNVRREICHMFSNEAKMKPLVFTIKETSETIIEE